MRFTFGTAGGHKKPQIGILTGPLIVVSCNFNEGCPCF